MKVGCEFNAIGVTEIRGWISFNKNTVGIHLAGWWVVSKGRANPVDALKYE